jgi:hypothetical protein
MHNMQVVDAWMPVFIIICKRIAPTEPTELPPIDGNFHYTREFGIYGIVSNK